MFVRSNRITRVKLIFLCVDKPVYKTHFNVKNNRMQIIVLTGMLNYIISMKLSFEIFK